MIHVPMVVAGAFLLALSGSAVRADSFIWSPQWDEGAYWVVASPLLRHPPDPATGMFGEPFQDGKYHTRFSVTSESTSSASRAVTLEVKYREPDFGFDEMLDSAELRVDMARLHVSGVKLLGERADGAPIEFEREFRPDTRPAFAWTFGDHGVPSTLPLLLPVFERVDTPTGPAYKLRDLELSHDSYSIYDYAQSVEVTEEGAVVEAWFGDGALQRADEARCQFRLRFAADKPWPEVIAEDGTIQASVVEVGNLP